MRRIPVLPTLVVLIALLTMIGLGLWQIRRAEWKEGLLARYQAAGGAPALDGLPVGAPIDAVAFRHTAIDCTVATKALQLGGMNKAGQTGFRNIVGCSLADGRRLAADLGWGAIDARPAMPAIGERLHASGPLIPDDVLARRVFPTDPSHLPLLIVMETPVAGLQPSVPPSIADIPNNHRGYAVQWFIFALTAAVIYAIALRRRMRG